ncbi:uncharacterized protein LOC6739614 [Drosophila simulans]|uniref:GD17625 n=2 Tax=melanogaster subgroup TaxID=32351 RepID=B4NT03_DROSI|nr:uncharacterized protein LOC6739614 [Drosophila simulans]XP_033160725.1 uncharacterized protein LOC117141410 [Drosophila mauritiana]EDX15693.1 GD17625 [Drosophila simulans]KMY97433.1 uncharacterized protein Dsimw501_GD17625 [Drosophila simulans]
MLLPTVSGQSAAGCKWKNCCRRSWEMLMAPVSPKNLRTTALLTSIYQLLISHCALFLVLLGLAHAEQMCEVLELDILDQKDNGFYNMSPFHNDLRLQTAAQLAVATENLLYVMAGIAGTYALSAISLFFGVFKNRPGLIIPWLVVEFLLMIGLGALVFMLRDTKIVQLLGGQVPYFIICYILICMDYCKWYVMHSFYQSLRTMNKLREIATVAIPCPAPGAIPYRFQREHMYLGSNGYKHILTESPDGQC